MLYECSRRWVCMIFSRYLKVLFQNIVWYFPIIKYKIETSYDKIIYSCLLLFPKKDDDNNKSIGEEGFIITSTNSTNDNNTASATKIYSFTNGTLIRYIHNSNNYSVWYLLSWYNKKIINIISYNLRKK